MIPDHATCTDRRLVLADTRGDLTQCLPGDLTPSPLRGANFGFADIISGAERGLGA